MGRESSRLVGRNDVEDLDNMDSEKRYLVVSGILQSVCRKNGGVINLSSADLKGNGASMLIDSDGNGGLVLRLLGK